MAALAVALLSLALAVYSTVLPSPPPGETPIEYVHIVRRGGSSSILP